MGHLGSQHRLSLAESPLEHREWVQFYTTQKLFIEKSLSYTVE
jgi:hypothetical protein